MAVARNPDEPLVNYGRPTPETGARATSLIPQTAVPGGFELPAGALSPDVISALQGTDLQGAVRAATAPYQDLPQFRADAEAQRAQAAYEARLAAFQEANPKASFFEARWNSLTPQEQAELRTSYGSAGQNLDKSLEYKGVAPAPGQDLVDYMLANQGNMPEIGVKKGPTGLEALAKIALLGGGFMLGGPLIQGLLSGMGAAGAAGAAGAGAGAGAATLGATIPTTVAGLVPTSTALGAGSLAGQLGATLAGGATLGATIPSTVAGLVPTSTALGPGSLAGQLGASLAGTTAGSLAPTAAGNLVDELVVTAAGGGASPAIPGVLGGLGVATSLQPPDTGYRGTPDNYLVDELVLEPSTTQPAVPPVVAPGGSSQPPPGRGTPDNYLVDELTITPSTGGLQPYAPALTLLPSAAVTAVPPAINPFQPGLTPMPVFPVTSPTLPTPGVSTGPTNPTGPTAPQDPVTPTKPTTPTTPTPRDPAVLRPTPRPGMSSESFNLNAFLRNMTSPRAGQANLGNVSPFSGGVGPAPGSLNLKGSSAPDIYPWVQDSGG